MGFGGGGLREVRRLRRLRGEGVGLGQREGENEAEKKKKQERGRGRGRVEERKRERSSWGVIFVCAEPGMVRPESEYIPTKPRSSKHSAVSDKHLFQQPLKNNSLRIHHLYTLIQTSTTPNQTSSSLHLRLQPIQLLR